MLDIIGHMLFWWFICMMTLSLLIMIFYGYMCLMDHIYIDGFYMHYYVDGLLMVYIDHGFDVIMISLTLVHDYTWWVYYTTCSIIVWLSVWEGRCHITHFE